MIKIILQHGDCRRGNRLMEKQPACRQQRQGKKMKAGKNMQVLPVIGRGDEITTCKTAQNVKLIAC
ncbi:hypothetical protein [Dickeya solani]|uniref:hypothetical protein n=1 Tax=Dickeya solani TaxID=1089444 RepID=UPI001576C7F6|nr:hypothetical protein [Dickeya solani]